MKPLKVLIVEDSENDAALVLRELQKAGYSPTHRRVETAKEMADALESENWDIILSDYVLPNFSGLDAFRLLRDKGLDLPFIVVSGQIGEDVAVNTMKAGANDYIMKSNLKRLGPAIERELAEAENRRQRKRAEDELEKYHASLEQLVKQRTVELEASEEQFRRAIEESPIPIVMHAENGQVLQLSRSWTELTGYTKQDMPTFDAWLKSACSAGANEIRQHELQLFHGEKAPINLEFPIRTKDNQLRYWSFNASSPGTLISGQLFIVIVGVDVTERKQVEQLKDEFIGMVSHELRTPITVVVGAIYTAMSKGITRKEERQLLGDAASSAESLARIIDNLLDLSRAQANRLMITKQPVDLAEIAHDVAERLKGRSAIHRLVIDMPVELISLKADRVRVERVLYNLIDNAIKYSPHGGDIIVFARYEDKRLVIGVKDSGIGISVEDQSKLFMPFERLQTTRGISGVGLGLNVCRLLVQAHGGHIWVESQPGQGSTFFFTLPFE